MPTVIDSLLVLLKLDPSEFTDGQKEAAASLGKFTDQAGAAFEKLNARQKRAADDEDRRGKDRLKQNKETADSYKKITEGVLGWATALISAGAIVDFAKNTAQMDAGLGRFAERLDLNKDQLALWVGMLNNVTGSTQASAKSVQQSADALNQVRFSYMIGDTSKTGVVQALGLSMADLQDPLAALDKIHKHIVAMHMSSRTATPLLRQLGIDDATISVLERGSKEYDDWMDSAKRSVPATKDQMQAAEDNQRAMGELDGALTRLANDIEGSVLPALTHLTQGAANAAEQSQGSFQRIEDDIGGMLGAFAKLGQSTSGDGSLNIFGRGAIAIFGTVHMGLMYLGAAIEQLINGLGGLARIAAAAASGDWKGVASAWQGVLDSFHATNVDVQAKVGDYWHRLVGVVTTGRMPGQGPAPAAAPAGGGGGGAAPAGGGSRAPAGSLAAQAEAAALAAGVSPTVAHGIAAAVSAEGAKSATQRDEYDSRGRYAYGLFQFRGAEQKALFAKYGQNANLAQQIEFFLSRSGAAHWGGSAQDIAYRTISDYLRPGRGAQGDRNRADAFLGTRSRRVELAGAGGEGGVTIGSIGTLQVVTQAKDARGMARDLAPELVAQTSRGLS